jgi:hypothetical protein
MRWAEPTLRLLAGSLALHALRFLRGRGLVLLGPSEEFGDCYAQDASGAAVLFGAAGLVGQGTLGTPYSI